MPAAVASKSIFPARGNLGSLMEIWLTLTGAVVTFGTGMAIISGNIRLSDSRFHVVAGQPETLGRH